MTNANTPPGPNDLLDAWRTTASDMEQRWNEFLNGVMGTEAFAQMMARSMDGYVTMQASFAKGMEQYLKAINIPTRQDVAQIMERLGALEGRIDALATMLAGPEGAKPIAPPRRSRASAAKRSSSE